MLEERGGFLTQGTYKLNVDNVSISYMAQDGNDMLAVSDFSMQIPEGEFICIVGPSGCGKSTMINAIAGLLPVTNGNIYLDGVPIKGPDRDRGVVFQQASLFPWRTALKNVTYGLELSGIPKQKRKETGMELLQLVGLDDFADSYPGQLSGGMQQRINLARALAIDPSLLLMDEPFGALDSQTREGMQAELLRIWKTLNKTIVLVTHDIGEAIYLGDRVFVMSARPGHIMKEIDITLPRPRAIDIKRSSDFQAIEREIWQDIGDVGRKDPALIKGDQS